jgi:hypothetical protein
MAKGTIEALRGQTEDQKKQAGFDRSDRANKRTFGAYIDSIEAEIEKKHDYVKEIEKKIADGVVVSGCEDFNKVMEAQEIIRDLEEQKKTALETFEEWFGTPFRQTV